MLASDDEREAIPGGWVAGRRPYRATLVAGRDPVAVLDPGHDVARAFPDGGAISPLAGRRATSVIFQSAWGSSNVVTASRRAEAGSAVTVAGWRRGACGAPSRQLAE